ncbi:MAG: hypothetical protein SFW65_02850 [Alphaproteobacteria bacterium]|nr:hypothetical protein [Alphaproteobacteria bacterium]
MLSRLFQTLATTAVSKLSKAYLWVGSAFKKHTRLSADDLSIVGAYCAAMGLASWSIFRWLSFVAADISFEWNSGVGPTQIIFNTTLITYAILVCSVIGLVALLWVCEALPFMRRLLVRLANACSVLLLLCSCAAVFITSLVIARIYFIITFLVFVPHAVCFFKSQTVIMMKNHSSGFIRYAMPLVLFVPLALAFALAIKAWFPVQIPNDYIEVADTVVLHGKDNVQTKTISRSDAVDCMEAAKYPDSNSKSNGSQLKPQIKKSAKDDASIPRCRFDISSTQLQKLYEPVLKTGTWQAQAGRLLYHHSYVFVPAIHALHYGLASPIPYLYGLGNTLFHAALLHLTSPTLTSYFDTYPIAQLTGILCIMLLISYISRNSYAAVAGLSVVLVALFQLKFEFVLLPPGFSPLRYAGLALQVASIFLLFRGTSLLRPFGMMLALAASFFWNAEYAMIGAVGQGMALVSPQYRISAWGRFGFLGLAALIAVGGMVGNGWYSTGYLQGMALGLFGLFPMLPTNYFLVLCALVATGIGLLIYATKQFTASEAMARLCVLPIMALLVVKFLFYALAVHLFYSMMFIVPLVLTYIDWSNRRHSSVTVNRRWMEASFAASFALLAFINSITYYSSALKFREIMSDPFGTYQWSGIGEHFNTNIPPEPIVSRVEAVRSQLRAGDRVLFLSPFDHLLSFYTNPQHYCGHFEIVLNPITTKMVRSLVDCARDSTQLLIVYDEAERYACPDGWRAQYYDRPSCEYKRNLKQNALTILRALGDDIVPVTKIGPLTFYRKNH